MTFLYLCGPTYRAIEWKNVEMIWLTFLPQLYLVVSIILLAIIGISAVRRSKTLSQPVNAGVAPLAQVNASIPFILFQSMLFGLLWVGIRRLQVVGIPALILMAITLFSQLFLG